MLVEEHVDTSTTTHDIPSPKPKTIEFNVSATGSAETPSQPRPDPPLLTRRRHIRHSPLISLPHPARPAPLPILALVSFAPVSVLFQPCEREPGVVVGRVVSEFLFVLYSTFAEDGEFHAGPVAVCRVGEGKVLAFPSCKVIWITVDVITLTLFLESSVRGIHWKPNVNISFPGPKSLPRSGTTHDWQISSSAT